MNSSRSYDGLALRLCPCVLAVIVAGCSLLRPPPRLARRYKSVEPSSVAQPVLMSIGISSLPVDPPESARFKDLSDHGQGAYVEALGHQVKTPEQLRAAIAARIETAGQESEFEDQLEFSRRLVITVARTDWEPEDYSPADRLAWTKVTITPHQTASCLRFVSWSLAQTEYSSLDIGRISSSESRSVAGQLGVTAQGVPVPISAQINASTQNTLSEELALRQRIEALTPVLRTNRIEITREGFTGADLTGNTVFDVKMIYDKSVEGCQTKENRVVTSANLFDKKDRPLPAAKASIIERRIRVVDEPHDLTADVTLRCIIRHVIHGARNLNEGDQVVAFQRCVLSDNSPQVLIPAEAWSATVWMIEEIAKPHGQLAAHNDTDAASHPLLFGSRDLAEEFRRWLLLTGSGSIGAHRTLGIVRLSFSPQKGRTYPALRVVGYRQ
jgi:hypothetical protein